MSAVQVACAVAVPLLWGYQFVAIKVGVDGVSAPVLLSRCASWPSRPLLIPFVEKARTAAIRSDRGDFGFPRRTEFRAVLCRPWARLGQYVGRSPIN